MNLMESNKEQSNKRAKIGGRVSDPSWEKVTIIQKSVICKDCGLTIHKLGKTHIERVKEHFELKCPKRANLVSSQPLSHYFLPKLSDLEQLSFEKHFSLWFYTSGTPFYKVDNTHLKEALNILRPGIQIPSRKKLSNKLLEDAYNTMFTDVLKKNSGLHCTLTTDGWTDVNGKPRINYCLTTRMGSFFLESVCPGSKKKTSEFIANDVERIITKYHMCNINATVMDNTHANRKAFKLLEEKYPKKFFHGCVAHVINLLFKDILKMMPRYAKFEKDCKDLANLFHNTVYLNTELTKLQEQNQVRTLARPGTTRWNGIYDLFKTILLNEKFLLQLVNERQFLDGSTYDIKQKKRVAKDLVGGALFLENLNNILVILKPLKDVISLFQDDKLPPSEVYSFFLELNSYLC